MSESTDIVVVGWGQGKVGCDPSPIINHPRGVPTSDRGYWAVKNGSLLSWTHEKSDGRTVQTSDRDLMRYFAGVGDTLLKK